MILQMEMFDTFFGLKLAHFIFSAVEQFSINLQAKDITIQEAIHGAELLIRHLKCHRTESKFNLFYNQVIELSSNLTEPPMLPRYRKVPRRFDDGEGPHRYLEPKDRYHYIYYEALEVVAGEVERRFDQTDLHIIKDLELLLLSGANGERFQIPEALSSYMEGDVDQAGLKIQLLMIPDMIKTAFDGSYQESNINENTHRCNE